LKEFLNLLNSHRVEYILIGGYAVAYHGYPRPTGDLDVWVATTPENTSRLEAVLQEFGFEVTGLCTDLAKNPERVLRMGVPPLRIEILTRISGVDFERCYRRRIVDEMDGVPLNIISVADLRRNKRASNRKKDLADLDNLP
jgi:hypothetical protein